MAIKILAVTSEAYPLAKTGGLGDAVSGMARSVQAMGADITIMLPAYKGVRQLLIHARVAGHLTGLPGGEARLIKGYCRDTGISVLLLENNALYERDGLYVDENGVEYGDSALRFAALSHAAARVAAGLPGARGFDVLHAHDWHAALAPLVLRQIGASNVKSVLTLHNIAFQGSFDAGTVDQTGINPALWESGGLMHADRVNYLHSGIVCADKITVVSQNYAREILTPDFGCGLEGTLGTRQADLLAIANGIDVSVWNPVSDPHLKGCHFHAEDLSNKVICKRKLQLKFGLDESPDAVVLAMGSRLTGQKMADVAAGALPRALDSYPNLQVCVIGCGEKHIEARLRELSERYPGRCSVHIGYCEDLAHLLHAGADILLHGSRFEPFGLTPLYAMRYGTIPIGSQVGGMVDTIRDPGLEADDEAMKLATGLLFKGDRVEDMCAAIDRALRLRTNGEVWLNMQRNAMRRDFSWEQTAPEYIRCYDALCQDRQGVEHHRIAQQARTPLRVRPVPAATRQMGISVA